MTYRRKDTAFATRVAARVDEFRLRAKPELKSMLLRHPTYKLRDVIDLFHEARKYTCGRLPIVDRETCIAILLSRDERNNGSPLKLEMLETLTVVTGRKLR